MKKELKVNFGDYVVAYEYKTSMFGNKIKVLDVSIDRISQVYNNDLKDNDVISCMNRLLYTKHEKVVKIGYTMKALDELESFGVTGTKPDYEIS